VIQSSTSRALPEETRHRSTSVVFSPRFIRLRDAPLYLGMDKNRFNRDVRPRLHAIPIGTQGVAFDRLDLDAWADDAMLTRAADGPRPRRRRCHAVLALPAARLLVGKRRAARKDGELARTVCLHSGAQRQPSGDGCPLETPTPSFTLSRQHYWTKPQLEC
jgi:hypothetical protein